MKRRKYQQTDWTTREVTNSHKFHRIVDKYISNIHSNQMSTTSQLDLNNPFTNSIVIQSEVKNKEEEKETKSSEDIGTNLRRVNMSKSTLKQLDWTLRPSGFMLLRFLHLFCLLLMLEYSQVSHCQRMPALVSPDQLPAEARGTNQDQGGSPANTLNQFVSLIMNSLATQQGPQNRRPMGPNGINTNNQPNVPLLQPAVANSQLNPMSSRLNPSLIANQPQSSTPIPFPNRNLNRITQPSIGVNGANNVNGNGGMFISSSPPPSSYLQLNRINPQLGIQNQPKPQFPNQPMNSIPLGSFGSNSINNNQQNTRQSQQNHPNHNLRPQPNPNHNFRQNNINRLPLKPQTIASLPPLVSMANNGVSLSSSTKPLSGFAPSGPPPMQTVNLSQSVGSSQTSSPPSTAPTDLQTGSSEQGEVNRTTFSTAATTSERPTSIAEVDKVNEASTSSTTSSDKTTSNPTTESASNTDEPPSGSSSSSTGRPTEAAIWNPMRNDSTTERPKLATSLSPSPDIVTVPPGYNPDNPKNEPSSYDISVSAQMGNPSNPMKGSAQDGPQIAPTTTTTFGPTPPIVAPTAVTTIIWSPPPSSQVNLAVQPSSVYETSKTITIDQTATLTPTPISNTSQSSKHPLGRVRDDGSSSLDVNPDQRTADKGVVYGKAPQGKPTPPTQLSSPSPTGSHVTIESSMPGRPFIQSVQVDNQVRPFAGQTRQQQPGASGQSHRSNSPFKASRPIGSDSQDHQSGMHVGSGFSIAGVGNQTMPSGDIQDYLAGQPPFLASSGSSSETPGSSDVGTEQTSSSRRQDSSHSQTGQANSTMTHNAGTQPTPIGPTSQTLPRLRRPTFRPKPEKPPIRIDSCIVGDDSSCEQSHNERCITEYGISSCHCKPGFARLSQLRGPCKAVDWFQLSLKIDRLSDDRRLSFNRTLLNPNSEEYQYLEFESVQAITWAIQRSSMGQSFMGARVNKFFEKDSKVWANLSISFDSATHNLTSNDRKQPNLNQELTKLIQENNSSKSLGDSMIVVLEQPAQSQLLQSAREGPVSRLVDVNECAQKDLNDCSGNATCTNEFGGFQCQCLPGYEDKHGSSGDPNKLGRVCLGCSPNYCSNRGTCSIVDGQKQCKCRPNFIGTRCDIDSEVLMVAVVGSLVGIIILIITFWCLFVFNRRWKREQQKMDAISATSGLTYNYITSSNNNGLMTQARNLVPHGVPTSGLQRSANVLENSVRSVADTYGKRFNATGRHQDAQFIHDQQAILGSTSSGSSAAIQPIGYNSAFAASQYDDAAGLLLAPVSSGSSEQTSPSDTSYRSVQQNLHHAFNAYTLSGHHHHVNANSHAHHHHHHHHRQQSLSNMSHLNKSTSHLSQFQPALEFRGNYGVSGGYDGRWLRAVQPDANAMNRSDYLHGYYPRNKETNMYI